MRNPSITLLFLLITLPSFSQITINLPLSRSVFQRDNNNTSIIYISGNYDDDLEKIEARLVPIKQEQGTPTDWVILTDKPERGSFVGTIKGTGGWYELQVRGWKSGIVIAEHNVDKVGIGEVFLIAGQSNAEGKRNFGEKPSTDDRVNCFNYEKIDYLDEIPPYNSFSHLDAKSSIAPRGQGTWCWGELGDLLANRLNVPIMFFNAAYEGSSIENWYSSSNLLSTIHPFYKFTYPRDTPYSYMRITLQYYLSQLGLRSVLWCQGEAELDLKTTGDYYAVALKRLIEKSRFDSGKKISWVISRTSLIEVNQTSPAIINAQNSLINPSENIFEGPYTDSIQVPRLEGVHFQNISADNAGITDLAKAWNLKLNDTFFNQSVPFLPAPILALKTSCVSFDTVTLSLPSIYSFQKWSNNTTQSSIKAQNGKFSCIVRDERGVYSFTSWIDLERVFSTKKPLLFSKTNPNFCEGTSVDLIAESPYYSSFLWNTGEVKKQITVKNSGRYAVRGIDDSGCGTLESNVINTQIVPLPAKPSITSNTANISCEGTPIILTSSSTNENIWSTNENARNITLTQVGDYTISVKTIDENGCASPFSDPSKFTIKASPETPEITQVGTYTLQAKQKNFLPEVNFEWKKDGSIVPNKTAFIKAAKPAFFTVLASQNYTISNTQTLTCRSNLSGAFSFIPDITIKNIIMYPNPSPDGLVTIEAQENLNGLALIVYSLKGQIIYSTAVPSLTERRLVDLSFLSEGKYIVKLISSSFEEVKQIWIEKK